MYSATIIQERQLFKGGNYWLLGLSECENYSREETIRGNTVSDQNIRQLHC